ncbi:F-box/LRR-repeat protein At3g26922-like [Lotus japonicus]|uniref:F-box/LRR-repeat protein At3g26922-like n=1 Tax=Lotus japonicus TaxID=34305 RepID=UPI002586B045|nr:F-box/LRR-repeat protein At3g26922-like [Lotus japonicus]XP_057425999.1 F-box/LRR-repeat protein At3g26922-like [Lotus japonicus]XP_057426005.1 F-box/LRR-repeat protein At3g26922-like [Lotus japonicus]XP_057426011.1 F-box/LRR-repeat protein At3g26922-like [Lotus japonicus]
MSDSTVEMLIPPKAKPEMPSQSENEDSTDSTVEKAKRGRHSEGESESESKVNNDRLSDLPDCVLLHILSFVKARNAVQTCILSTRWKDLWKSLPSLILLSPDFSTLKIFTKFVSKLLELRDGSLPLHSFDFERHGSIEYIVHRRVVDYALSHNVQRLAMTVEYDYCHVARIFSCQSLTSLKLSVHPKQYNTFSTSFPISSCLNLPALTSLHLVGFTFHGSNNGQVEPFSAFKKLHSLIIRNCTVKNAQTFCISSTTLVDVTMRTPFGDFHKIELSAPSLQRFDFTGSSPYKRLCGSSLSSVKELSIDAYMGSYSPEPPLVLLSWLEELTNIKSLTVSTNTLQVLFLIPDLVNRKLPFLSNLKSLKVKVQRLSYILRMTMIAAKIQKATTASRREAARLRKEAKYLGKTIYERAPIPAGIVDFLLQNSPTAKVETKMC